MRESRAKKAERVTTVLRLLKETYPDAKPELDPPNVRTSR